MICSSCRNEIPNDSKTCPICQNILAEFFETKPLTKKQKIQLLIHKMIFPSIMIILILGIIVGLYTKNKIKYDRITDISNLKLDPTNEHYVNDLYMSDDRFYKYMLNEDERKIYNTIYRTIKNKKELITIKIGRYDIPPTTFKTQTLKKIRDTLMNDHPELIEVNSINITNIYDDEIVLRINYIRKENLVEDVKNQINEIKTNANNLDEIDKIKYVYDWFKNTEFINKNSFNDSAYLCIVDKKCTRKGYAKSIQIVLQNLNINSLIAIGEKDAVQYEWNLVKVDNKYYNYDQTLSHNSTDNYDGLFHKLKKIKITYKSMTPKINSNKNLK
jgi:hypothetical protein